MPEREPVSSDRIIENAARIAGVVGKYGVAAMVFALPTVIGCFGVYFLAIAIGDAQVSTAKVAVGIFATVFGSGLAVLLLYLFTNMNLWDKLGLSKLSQDQQKTLSELETRVKALEALEDARRPEQARKMAA